MKTILLIPASCRVDDALLRLLIERYEFKMMPHGVINSRNPSDKNSLAISQMRADGVHPKFIKIMVAPGAFDGAKKIADRFNMNTDPKTCLVLVGYEDVKQVREFLGGDNWTLCFAVGFPYMHLRLGSDIAVEVLRGQSSAA